MKTYKNLFSIIVGDTLLKTERVESHEEAIVRHLKEQRIQEIKITTEQQCSYIKSVRFSLSQ